MKSLYELNIRMMTSCAFMAVMAVSLPANAAIITLTGLSNTDWASVTDNATDPSRYNSSVVAVDSVVVGNRAGSPNPVGDGSNTATIDVSTFLDDGDGGGSGAPLAYTVSGLDLDGVGGFNDSFVLTFAVTSTSGGISTPGGSSDPLSGGLPTNAGDLRLVNAGALNNPGEFIEFAYSDLSVNLNGGIDNGVGTFDGFSGAQMGSWGGSDVARVNTTNYAIGSFPTGFIDLTPGGLDAGLRVEDSGTGGYDLFSWDVQVTAIPEPSMLALTGIASLMLLRRRR